MKIYNVYCGELFELEVTETEKMYIAEKRIKEFDHKERFKKKDCFLTQDSAIDDYIKKGMGEIELLEGAIAFIKNSIECLQKNWK